MDANFCFGYNEGKIIEYQFKSTELDQFCYCVFNRLMRIFWQGNAKVCF